MPSNQHYYEDDCTNHIHHQPQHRRHRDGGGVGCHDANRSTLDPCDTNKACIDACQAMSSVNHSMAMCGGGVNLSKFSPSHYFGGNHEDHGDGMDHHSSPYMYNPGGPVGPTSCEYCGSRNTNDCTSNLPEEYLLFMENNGGLDRTDGGSNVSNPDSDAPTGETGNNGNRKIGTPNNYANSKERDVCPRPKLFFLKKRPPFATPEGWNPVTQYRTNLFEPPSSVEGMGRGWGEVRGHLGGANGANATSTSNNNGNALNRSYANSHCESSACGRGEEAEISFSSVGDRNTNIGTSDGRGSLSPVGWVSGLMGSLSPS